MHVTISKLNENYVMVRTDSESLFRSLVDHFTVVTEQAGWREMKRQKEIRESGKAKSWDGKTRLLTGAGRLPYGLVGRLCAYLKDGGIPYTKDYETPSRASDFVAIKAFIEDETKQFKKNLGFEPYDYQKKTVANGIMRTRSLNLSATSSGKSATIYLFAKFRLMEQEKKTLIIVPRITLVEQLAQDFSDYSGGAIDDHVHMIYGGHEKDTDKKIVISTWQSLQDEPRAWFRQFDTLIVDEVHGATAAEMKKLINKCEHIVYRWGLTGTLSGMECDAMVIEGFFGEPFTAVTTRQMIDRGIATPAEVHIMIMDHPNKETTRSKIKREKSPIRRYQAENEIIESNIFRNAFIAKLALSKQEKGENTLILFKSIDHGKLLQSLVPGSELIYGAIRVKDRLAIKNRMKENGGVTLVASYGTFSTGESIPRIHNIIAAGNYKGRIKVLQSIGRGLRLHDTKEVVKIFDIADDLFEKCSSIEHLKERLLMYREPEIDFPYTIKKIRMS